MTESINWLERISSYLNTAFHIGLDQASGIQLHEAVAPPLGVE